MQTPPCLSSGVILEGPVYRKQTSSRGAYKPELGAVPGTRASAVDKTRKKPKSIRRSTKVSHCNWLLSIKGFQ